MLLRPEPDKPPPTPAPAWVALLAAWLGLAALVMALVEPFLPGSRNPRAEEEHRLAYSLADRFLPFPIYASVAAIFFSCIVFWQMRKVRRPLVGPLASQRLQAYVGLALAVGAVVVIYVYVHRHRL